MKNKKGNTMKVYYIGYYIEEKYSKILYSNVPGRLKMQYVNDRLTQVGYDVEIISLNHRENKGKVKSTDKIKYYFSLPFKNKYVKRINMFLMQIQLLFTFLFRIKKEDVIVLYHSYTFTHFFNKLRKIKKVPIIIEVEEVYGFSATGHRPYLDAELQDIKLYDKAIFVNDYIPVELDFLNKSYVVSYGVVNLVPPLQKERFKDGKIHAMYAGTIEQRKLGAYSAVKAAEFLPDDYQVDVYGFGSKDSLNKLSELISDINTKAGWEKVRYMGYRSSNELSEIMTMYDIGLSTNVMEPDFANNTFPSKIITYMSHGLSIVSGYAKAFDGIELSEKWSFFYEYTPEAIAEAIKNYKPCTIQDNLKVLEKIDNNLITWLKENIG